ncbi:FAD synthase [Patescibacteria group bacterium]|nr:FAD synthase [Patescibacteria group bacterium]MBU1682932.1 FAD synthase [Patescibacteria group bacterium]MBU1935225.1 FAD synthase [Patescibacteria group bacterium]
MSDAIKVMGFGTFDGLHPGHLNFLRQLKELGDEVYVVIARDRNVKRIKGKKPVYNEKERLEALKKSGLVDRVLMGHATDFYHMINKFQPHVIGLGYDQKADTNDLQKVFPKMEIRRLNALEPEKYKSSLLN